MKTRSKTRVEWSPKVKTNQNTVAASRVKNRKTSKKRVKRTKRKPNVTPIALATTKITVSAAEVPSKKKQESNSGPRKESKERNYDEVMEILNVVYINLQGLTGEKVEEIQFIQNELGSNVIVLCETHHTKTQASLTRVSAELLETILEKWSVHEVPCECKITSPFAGAHGMCILVHPELESKSEEIKILGLRETDHRQIMVHLTAKDGTKVDLAGVHYKSGNINSYFKKLQIWSTASALATKPNSHIKIAGGDMNCHPTWNSWGFLRKRLKKSGLTLISHKQLWNKKGPTGKLPHTRSNPNGTPGNCLDHVAAALPKGSRLSCEVTLLSKPDYPISSDHDTFLNLRILKNKPIVIPPKPEKSPLTKKCNRCGWRFKKFVHKNCPSSYNDLLCKCGEEKIKSAQKAEIRKSKKHLCFLCGKKFMTACILSKHKRIHTEEKPFKCRYCEATFRRKDGLHSHTMTHTGGKPHKCTQWQLSFRRPQELREHTKIYTGEKPYKCEKCYAWFRTKTLLKRHLKIHSKERPFKCDKCTATFKRINSLNDHIRIHSNARPFKCDKCEASFKTLTSLGCHKRIHTGKKPLLCDYCGEAFRTTSALKVHVMTHTGEKPHKCTQCKASFIHPYLLRDHAKLHTGERPFKCQKCNSAFTNQAALNRHQILHSKLFQCDHCEAKFSRKDSLNTHELIHTGDKPYKCDKCCEKFRTKTLLKRHLKIHERPFKCDKCTATFKTINSVKEHSNIHSGERPFKCDKCKATFHASSNLREHKLIHTNKKPFKCDYCKAKFRTTTYLKRHIMTHTVEKPHKCTQCAASFVTPKLLRVHVMIHTGERPFKCDYCGDKFRTTTVLKRHILTHTREKRYKSAQCKASF